MTQSWIEEIPEPDPDAIRIDAVVDEELGVIVQAVTADGREATAAESW